MTDLFNTSAPPLAPAATLPVVSTPRLGPRKKASTACSACRARRSKCIGGIPCESCISHRTDCVKDESEDGRRRVAIKRKLEGLEEDRDVLDALIMRLRNGSDAQTDALLNFIRANNTGRMGIRTFLEESYKSPDGSSQDSPRAQYKGGTTTGDGAVRGRARTGGISDLMNPSIQVPAKPWTTVTDDDDLVSHLISIWFAWIHPWFRWVEADIFIEAMRAQDTTSPFCTPYLVDSMLAEACLLDVPDMRDRRNYGQLRRRFADHAKIGIDNQQGRTSLALVQALGIRWTSLYLNGEDRMGRLMFNTQIFLAKSLVKWRSQVEKKESLSEDSLQKIDKCMNAIDWVLFGLNAVNLADCRFFNPITGPSREMGLEPHDSALSQGWFSYPLHKNMPSTYHPDCHFRHFMILAGMTAENEDISAQREKGVDQRDRLEPFMQALYEWPNRLPPCLQIKKETKVLPHVLVLHAVYHWVRLLLAKQSAAGDAGHPAASVITATPAGEHQSYWREQSLHSAVAIAELFNTYSIDWREGYFPPMTMQPITVALLALLEDIENHETQRAFVTLTKTLQSVAKKFRIGRGVMKVVATTAQEQRISLPAEAEYIFTSLEREKSEGETWGGRLSQERGDEVDDDEDITMDYLLEKWEDLSLDTETT